MTEINLDGAIQGSYDEESGEYEWWKPIDDSYWVSSFGRVWSEYKKGCLKLRYSDHGYSVAGIHEKQKRVHRLVAAAFIPNPDEKPQVNHKDGNKLNNNVSNLEWSTPSENSRHAYTTGLNSFGHYLTEKEREEVKELYGTGGYTQKELAEKFSVNESTIGKILKDFGCSKKCKDISLELGKRIADAYHENGLSLKDTAKMFNVSQPTVWRWYHEFYGNRPRKDAITDKFRKEVVTKYHEGKYTQEEIGEMFGITNCSVGNWHEKFYGNKLPFRKTDEFKKRVADKYHEGDHTQREIGEMFKVSEATVHNWHRKFYGNQKPQSE